MEMSKDLLPVLSTEVINAIFDCVYGELENETKTLLEDQFFKDFIRMLLEMQQFNYKYRTEKLREMYGIVGDLSNFEINSEGTSLWMALLLAIKDLYRLKDNQVRKIFKSSSIMK